MSDMIPTSLTSSFVRPVSFFFVCQIPEIPGADKGIQHGLPSSCAVSLQSKPKSGAVCNSTSSSSWDEDGISDRRGIRLHAFVHFAIKKEKRRKPAVDMG